MDCHLCPSGSGPFLRCSKHPLPQLLLEVSRWCLLQAHEHLLPMTAWWPPFLSPALLSSSQSPNSAVCKAVCQHRAHSAPRAHQGASSCQDPSLPSPGGTAVLSSIPQTPRHQSGTPFSAVSKALKSLLAPAQVGVWLPFPLCAILCHLSPKGRLLL